MKTRLIPSLSLFAVLLAACAPASTPVNPKTVETEPPIQPSATLVVPTVEVPTKAILGGATEESSIEEALPVATSRGPNLEATDPSTVSLASGEIQFVEFFQFW